LWWLTFKYTQNNFNLFHFVAKYFYFFLFTSPGGVNGIPGVGKRVPEIPGSVS
jgi:hypothetical protein